MAKPIPTITTDSKEAEFIAGLPEYIPTVRARTNQAGKIIVSLKVETKILSDQGYMFTTGKPFFTNTNSVRVPL